MWTPSHTVTVGAKTWVLHVPESNGWTYTDTSGAPVKVVADFFSGNNNDVLNGYLYAYYKTSTGTDSRVTLWSAGLGNSMTSHTRTVTAAQQLLGGQRLDRLQFSWWAGSSGNGQMFWYPAGHPSAPVIDPPTPTPTTPGASVVPPPVPAAPLTPVSSQHDGSPLDLAQDLADRSGDVVTVYDGQQWVVEPAVPTPGVPVLHVSVGSNLVRALSVLDLDTSDHAAGIRLRYSLAKVGTDRSIGRVAADGVTVVDDAVEVTARAAEVTNGGILLIDRAGVPVTEQVAQDTATRMAQRAWLRGMALEVQCPAAWWVRPRHTVRVTLRPGVYRDYWVATVRVSSTDAMMTLGLRPFTLGVYPAE